MIYWNLECDCSVKMLICSQIGESEQQETAKLFAIIHYW